MKPVTHRFLSLAAVVCFFLGLALSCSPKETVPVRTKSPNATSIDKSIPNTATSTPSNQPSLTYTVIPTLTTTITPIKPSPTWTPQPTLSPVEAKALVMDLLQKNGGCRLPCWWGITPGKTSWAEAEGFLQRLAISITIREEGNYQIADVHIPAPIEVPYITYLSQTYGIRDGIIETIQTYNYDLAKWIHLPDILNEYGQMNDVGISTFKNGDSGNIPFSVSIFYLDKSFLVEYVGYKKIPGTGEIGVSGNKIRVCPQGGIHSYLYLWSPLVKMSFDEAAMAFLDITNQPYPLHLSQATGLDVEIFFETYRNPNTKVCMETPADLWPKQ